MTIGTIKVQRKKGEQGQTFLAILIFIAIAVLAIWWVSDRMQAKNANTVEQQLFNMINPDAMCIIGWGQQLHYNVPDSVIHLLEEQAGITEEEPKPSFWDFLKPPKPEKPVNPNAGNARITLEKLKVVDNSYGFRVCLVDGRCVPEGGGFMPVFPEQDPVTGAMPATFTFKGVTIEATIAGQRTGQPAQFIPYGARVIGIDGWEQGVPLEFEKEEEGKLSFLRDIVGQPIEKLTNLKDCSIRVFGKWGVSVLDCAAQQWVKGRELEASGPVPGDKSAFVVFYLTSDGLNMASSEDYPILGSLIPQLEANDSLNEFEVQEIIRWLEENKSQFTICPTP